MIIHNHILVGSNIDYFWSKKNREPILSQDSIVIHNIDVGNAIATIHFLACNNTKSSAHLFIDRKGKICQMVDFSTQSWHSFKSHILGETNVNAHSIGIELQNVGLLRQFEGEYFSWRGRKIPDNEVVNLVNPQTGYHGYWQTYPDVQLQALYEVVILLLKTYNFKRIVGHNEISLIGEIDPGPAFPLDYFKKLIYTLDTPFTPPSTGGSFNPNSKTAQA